MSLAKCLQQPLAMPGLPHLRLLLPLLLHPYLPSSLHLPQQPLRSLRLPLLPLPLAEKTTCRSECDIECVIA